MLYLGTNIKEYRLKKGYTQEQLAYELGVSSQTISRWENGTTYPDIVMLPIIAELFDTSIDNLMGYAKECLRNIPLPDMQCGAKRLLALLSAKHGDIDDAMKYVNELPSVYCGREIMAVQILQGISFREAVQKWLMEGITPPPHNT